MMIPDRSTVRIAIIGLGYVGLPLALALSRHFPVTGFDTDSRRIAELTSAHDRNGETDEKALRDTRCVFSADAGDLSEHNLFIVTVPTPLGDGNIPDLSLLISASRTVAPHLKPGSVVVYESTGYPGVTEDVCGPVLESGSGLKAGKDFFLGYSPERINPGDRQHTVEKITKVVAGQTVEVCALLLSVYGAVNGGNIFCAKDIKTAEASKVIENAQRDINVAFINEVTQIMARLGLSMHDVLEAASTKWNFLPFRPGLVGGHCIGVDPYYLAHCAQALGHAPDIILAGRRTNDGMGQWAAGQLMARLPEGQKSRILVLGFTFKENITDIRNTKVMDVIIALESGGHAVDIHDPHADAGEVRVHYGREILPALPAGQTYDALMLAVAHDDYKNFKASDVTALVRRGGAVFDFRGVWRDHDYGGAADYLTI